MAYYPAFLDLKDKPCLVVGGGPLALHKARALARCGARLSVVAPRLESGFRGLKGARLARRPFREADLAGAWLVVAATDDRALNEKVSRLCRRKKIWVNVVDQPDLCDFILPSVVRRGLLTFAVSTGGASPALAKFVGGKLKKVFGPEYAALAGALKRLRPRLLKIPMARRRRLLSSLLTETNLNRFRREGPGFLDRLGGRPWKP